ncbi:MAG: hypothetical protein ACJA08_002665 [Cyclobacteriaceae bacterium]|jgi:uncharacterized protein (DUF1684 family)
MKILNALFFFVIGTSAMAQSQYEIEIKKWQQELNESYADPEESPLEKKELKKFKSLDFFPIEENYQVVAAFMRTPNEIPFNMPTSTERLPIYVKYGIAIFTLNGKEIELAVFQNDALTLKEEYKDYLFLPFTDETNGLASYGGGRYLDIRIPEGDTLIIDFNKAYNPYCAYSGRYSCPIPPRENVIALEIKAGVLAWKEH